MALINIGDNFGKWKVIGFDDKRSKNSKHGRKYYFCECQCKDRTIKSVREDSLTSQKSMSCGCYNREKVSEATSKHSLSDSNLYDVWVNMKQRCLNKNNPNYKNYGGRGITVCDEWINDFIKFKEWSIENGYEKGLNLDRKDNNKGYYPENCRFITYIENQNNKRTNTYIEFDNEVHTIADWAKKIDMNPRTLVTRLDTLNWSIEKALTTPVNKKRKR